MANRIPWEQIRQEYVQGIEQDGSRVYPSMRDLAEKYSILVSVIGRKAKADNWTAQRDIFANKVQTESERKTVEALADDASAFNLSAFKGAKAAVDKLTKLLTDNRGLMPDDMSKLSTAMKNFQVVGRLALGQTTEEVKETVVTVKLPEELEP